MPQKARRSKQLESAIGFYWENLDKIQKEHLPILQVLRAIEIPVYTVNPLRMRLWSQSATTTGQSCTPELSELEYLHKKWFSDCELNMAPAKDCLEDLKGIQYRVACLWLRAGANSPTPDEDPHVALEAAQSFLEREPTTENITSYLHTMALLVYSSRKTLEYIARMLSLWVQISKTHGGDLSTEQDAREQVLWCSKALCYEQQTWHLLMSCPWTVACALHLLTDDTPEPRMHHCTDSVPTKPEGMQDAESDDDESKVRIVRGKAAWPQEFTAVIAAIGNPMVQRMLGGCFRLDASRRESEQLLMAVRPFINDEDQSQKRSVHINLVSNMSRNEIKESDVIQMIQEYWKNQASSNTDRSAKKGFKLLSELADTSALSDNHLFMNLNRPKAHPECIIAQDWTAKRHVTNQLFPYIGVSRHVCQTGNSFLWAVLQHTDKHPTAYTKNFTMYDAWRRMIPGTRDAYHLCMVPEQSPIPVKRRVADELLAQMRRRLNSDRTVALLKAQLRTARGEEIGSDREEKSSEWDSDEDQLPQGD
ncbi:hypothetical protein DHEL01_v204950 [Diaporthe helianthi]|uniref:Uncharacterized protein n=1 Tax=Diaporthe helianthi TaxID=158607 RepID=A0A2P5I2A9_DIAHE|nr:hypothetical protein DHEL01_v204950 [Diaporthe helianthi]